MCFIQNVCFNDLSKIISEKSLEGRKFQAPGVQGPIIKHLMKTCDRSPTIQLWWVVVDWPKWHLQFFIGENAAIHTKICILATWNVNDLWPSISYLDFYVSFCISAKLLLKGSNDIQTAIFADDEKWSSLFDFSQLMHLTYFCFFWSTTKWRLLPNAHGGMWDHELNQDHLA